MMSQFGISGVWRVAGALLAKEVPTDGAVCVLASQAWWTLMAMTATAAVTSRSTRRTGRSGRST